MTDGPARICPGCADRLENDLERGGDLACRRCGRHRELCAVLPCDEVSPPVPASAPESTRLGRVGIAWLPVGQIDAPLPEHNSRRAYDLVSLAELAASVREHGILQPLCVRPTGARYVVVFGLRRLRAAIQAELAEVPCTIQVLDDAQAFLLNLVENLHRQHLSGAERVRAIERLAATGLGVREISRRTGFNASTISRWLRIDARPTVKNALEDGALDIGRAKILVEAPDLALPELVAEAPRLSPVELRARVAALKIDAPDTHPDTEDERRVQEALRLLRAVERVRRGDVLDALRLEVARLAGSAE
ncbi:MAG: ParB/RepB/Spo0J family partition protein [Chloroflexota bacterium]|nr:ParB/RepB/Spo0J family partition protein [Chloroflexota bacterium]